MKIIVAADKNWGIGLNNSLLVQIPNDMKFFRRTTTGNVIIMGRKTLESFPQGQPLSGRTNIVLTKNAKYKVNGAICVSSVEEAIEEAKKHEGEVFCIGGESIYRQFLPYCDEALVTKIDQSYQADSYFPNLDQDEQWEMVEESEEQTYFDIEYTFTKYKRK